MPYEPTTEAGPVGYVLKMYPRFSETFVVSEILARERVGEEVVVFSLRPPADPRFHPFLAEVRAPVIQIGRSASSRGFWRSWRETLADDSLSRSAATHLPELLQAGQDDVEQALLLASQVRRLGVRHLHAHFASVATTVARLASLVAEVPYSFTAHAKDIFHDEVSADDLETKLRDAHHAVTISAYNVEHLRERFSPATCERLHLVRNGIEVERFPYRGHRPRRAVPRLLAVGRLVEKKGFSLLIDAVGLLRARGVVCTLDIVGDGPLHADLDAQIAAEGLGSVVRLAGPRTQDEVRELLAGHDLFVAPFVVAADGNADGLPTVLLEAMAVGIPCVAADVTGVSEVVRSGETGWLTPSGDVTALAAAIEDALHAGDRLAEITDRARALVVENYDSARQARQLRTILDGAARGEVTA